MHDVYQFLCRIRIAALTGLFFALSFVAPHAQAQEPHWPSKPVRVVVGFEPGGTADTLARSVSNLLSKELNQAFIVENRPGAGANIATNLVVNSAPDGYTLIFNTVGPVAVNPTLYKNLPYDTLTDLVPIVQVANVPNVLVVPASLPLKNVEEFIAHLKANPGKLNYGSTGVGTAGHLTAVMLLGRSGAQATHIPYNSSNVITDLVAGRIQFMLATIPSVIQLVRNGKLRALAVTSEKRSRSLPDIPTLADSGYPGFQAGAWLGFFAPKGTPTEVVQKLNRSVNLVLPQLEAQMLAAGAEPVGGSPEDFKTFVHSEFVKWKAIVQESGASAH